MFKNTGPNGHNAQLHFFKEGVLKVYFVKIWNKDINPAYLTITA